MTAPKNRFGRALLRLAAAAGAAVLGAGAFALPAAAQDTEVVTEVRIQSPIEFNGDLASFWASIEFGDDFETGVHDVAITLEFVGSRPGDYSFNAGEYTPCTYGDDTSAMTCTEENAPTSKTAFGFQYAANDVLPAGDYPYRVVFELDGETVEEVEGTIEITPGEDDGNARPYLHGNVGYEGVEPGSTVDVAPEFYQDLPLSANAAAVVVTTWAPDYLPHHLATPGADYDNCIVNEGVNVTCVVTDFEDLPGTAFTFDTPIGYTVREDAPGPVDVCDCAYEVYTIGADRLEADFGGVFWDEGSDDLFGLRTVSEPESEYLDEFQGYIDITTTENPYDLAVDDLNAEGEEGEKVALTATVANEGPATAPAFFDGPGSYAVLGDLPKGLSVWEIGLGDDVPFTCVRDDDEYLDFALPEVDPADYDFICFFQGIEAGESLQLEMMVSIDDAGANAKGSIEVVAVDNDGYPGAVDGDKKNNTADITLNGKGDGPGKLPTTGTSMGLIVGAAALVVVAGVVLLILTARRRKAAGATEE